MYKLCGVKLLQVRTLIMSQKRALSGSIFHRGKAMLFSRKNLLLTNFVSSGAFMFLGDLVQQESEYQSGYIPERYDWVRSARMVTVASALGILHHYYYTYLDIYMPRADLKTVGKKIICDQLFASPATIIIFFLGMAYLEKKSLTQTHEELVYKFKYTYMGDCLFWPPVQFINFYFLPVQYRVFYINGATMVFNIFLSYMKYVY